MQNGHKYIAVFYINKSEMGIYEEGIIKGM